MKRNTTPPRDRNQDGVPEQARPRDSLGRPLPYGQTGAPPLPDPLPTDPEIAVGLAQQLLDRGLPFQAHEVLEELWKSCPETERLGWKGLAQLAVAITHDSRGNRRGTQLLLNKAAINLAAGLPALPAVIHQDVILDWLASAQRDLEHSGALYQPLQLTARSLS